MVNAITYKRYSTYEFFRRINITIHCYYRIRRRCYIFFALRKLTLCIFLRHWGCAECNLLLHTLTPRLSELVDLQVNILFVGLGSAEGISEFRSKHKLKKNRVSMLRILHCPYTKKSVWKEVCGKFKAPKVTSTDSN